MTFKNWNSMWLAPSIVMISPTTHATEYLTVEEAQKVIFANADEFKFETITLSDTQRDEIRKLSGVRQRSKEVRIWHALKKNETLGWFIVDEVIGKHEYITYAVGLSPAGQIVGIEILIYRETHGGQIRDLSWRKHFAGKTLKDKFKLDEDVPNISGATLSCRNVLDGVKRLLVTQKVWSQNG